MAHLDTAYKLGALQAQADFETEINKMAATGDVVPPPPQQPSVVNPQVGAGIHNLKKTPVMPPPPVR